MSNNSQKNSVTKKVTSGVDLGKYSTFKMALEEFEFPVNPNLAKDSIFIGNEPPRREGSNLETMQETKVGEEEAWRSWQAPSEVEFVEFSMINDEKFSTMTSDQQKYYAHWQPQYT